MKARVVVTEITGSESYIHLAFADVRWVMLAPGIHNLEADREIEVFIDPERLMVFDPQGQSVRAKLRKAA